MKKYLIGMIVGIGLTISASAYADDVTLLIGKTVQGVFPVKVNGDVLPKTAIVIDGTSYLPVRAIGEAIGYDVSFNADLGIELKNKEAPIAMSSIVETTPVTDPYDNAVFIDSSINGANIALKAYEGGLKLLVDKGEEDGEKAVKYRELIEITKALIADLEQKKAALTP